MLGRRDQHALFHQAGGVADASDIEADGLDFKAVKIGAAKYDTRPRWRRSDAHRYRCPAVQAHAAAFHGRADCLLANQKEFKMLGCNRKDISKLEITAVAEKPHFVVGTKVSTNRGLNPSI